MSQLEGALTTPLATRSLNVDSEANRQITGIAIARAAAT
jgi:hypothetical protein